MSEIIECLSLCACNVVGVTCRWGVVYRGHTHVGTIEVQGSTPTSLGGKGAGYVKFSRYVGGRGATVLKEFSKSASSQVVMCVE